jgi:hypothetical protein
MGSQEVLMKLLSRLCLLATLILAAFPVFADQAEMTGVSCHRVYGGSGGDWQLTDVDSSYGRYRSLDVCQNACWRLRPDACVEPKPGCGSGEE